MAKVSKQRAQSAADILKETAREVGVTPNSPESPVSSAKPKEDSDLVSLRLLVTSHEKALDDSIPRLVEIEKLIKELSRKLSAVDMRVSMVVDPQERDLPAEVAAGLDMPQLYSAVISGCFSGVFQRTRNLSAFSQESYRESLVQHCFQMGDTFLKSMDAIMGAVAADKLKED